MATKSDLRAKLEEELACAICYEHLKDPQLLPCQHSFCKVCLEEHHQSLEQQVMSYMQECHGTSS